MLPAKINRRYLGSFVYFITLVDGFHLYNIFALKFHYLNRSEVRV